MNRVAVGVILTILVATGGLLLHGGFGDFTLVLQGSFLTAVIGGIFTLASDMVTSNAKREQFRFEEIYPKQVKVIEKLHQMTIELESEVKSLVNPLQMQGREGQREMVAEASETGREIQRYLLENRIYLKESTCDVLEKLIEEHFKIWWKWSIALGETPPRLPLADEWKKEFDTVDIVLAGVRKQLEEDYRKIFGLN